MHARLRRHDLGHAADLLERARTEGPITEILEEFGNFGKYSVLVLLAFANVFFVIYDGAVRNITLAYRNWFRPKILKKAR